MSRELILKKLDQMRVLIEELSGLMEKPFNEFKSDFMIVRSAERNFQLIVDLASDVNTHILLERGRAVPDTYRQSFEYLQREGIIDDAIAGSLTESARIRNILVHEYDFEEDYEKFYRSVKTILPAYRNYIAQVHHFLSASPDKHTASD